MKKILTTLVWDYSTVKANGSNLSVDSEIQPFCDDVSVLKKLCLDRWANELKNESLMLGGWQLKSNVSFTSQLCKEVIIGFVYVEQSLYDFYTLERADIEVNDVVYADLNEQIISVGFEVCDSSFVSSFSHGINVEHETNRFGLYPTTKIASEVAAKNNKYLSEHGEWNVVELFLLNESFRTMNQ